jgi:nicotinamidase/pyrazinamidase
MKALILVDLQYDFCPGGSLAVPQGDRILPTANRLQEKFDLVVATQDWHPRGHASFASTHGRQPGEVIEIHGAPQTLWPDHCVQGSPGAELRAELDRTRIARVFRKGANPGIDSYSGFLDADHRNATGLADFLRERGVDEVYLAGLATDYCVRFTALDAVQLGFRANVVADACRGVNLRPGDSDAALAEMRAAGVRILNSAEILGPRRPGTVRKTAARRAVTRPAKKNGRKKPARAKAAPRATKPRRRAAPGGKNRSGK